MTARLTIEDMHALAEKRNGKCVSETYVSSKSKLEWECREGHRWEATPNNVQRGSWCPKCAGVGSSCGEQIARLILEAMFGAPFIKVRPEWLRGPGKRIGLELDGYAEALGIAFEYQGGQHYEILSSKYGDAEELMARQERDKLKRQLCWARGVRLVIIPEFTDNQNLDLCIAEVDLAVLGAYLKPPKRWKRPTSLSAIYGMDGVRRIVNMRLIAAERGGVLLSEAAGQACTKLSWQCHEGHRWEATSNNVQRGSWCPKCANLTRGVDRRRSIEDMRALAKKQNGKCLSETYIGNKSKLEWECVAGHRWEAIPNSIQRGTWCPKCAGAARGLATRLSIDDMHALAKKRSGKCLSGAYINAHSKLEWECAKNHRWGAKPGDIRHGQWCPACAGRPHLTIEDMHTLAAKRYGRCLSEIYTNGETKLEWECVEGHLWKARPSDIRGGHWCPKCSRKSPMRIPTHKPPQLTMSALLCEAA